MQLVLVAPRCGATLQIAHIGPLVGDDERPLELPRAGSVDAEVGRQLHRAAHTLGDVAERAVGEDGGVERRIEVVGIGDHAAQILLHQLRVVAHGLGHRAEDDAPLGERLLEGGLHRDGVHHGVDGYAGQRHLLLEGNAQAVEGPLEFGVDFIHRAQLLLRFGGRIVNHVLKVDFGNRQVGPRRGVERQPVAVGLHAALGHPLGFALLGRNQPHDLLREALADGFGLDVGGEAVLVLLLPEVFQYLFFVLCHCLQNIGQRYKNPSIIQQRSLQ